MSKVNSPNTGCLPNIGNGPQSGPPLYSKAEGRFAALSFYNGTKGRKAAQQFLVRPKAVEWLSIVLRGQNPTFGKNPEFGEFTLNQTQNVFFVALFLEMPYEGTAIKSLTNRCVQDVC